MRFSTVLFVVLFNVVRCQNQSRSCGLPENISQLPDFVQDEIKAVWKNYVPGTKCDKELLVMDDILAVLNMLETEIPGGVDGLSTQSQTSGTSGFTQTSTTPTTGRQEINPNSQTFLPLVSPSVSTSSPNSRIPSGTTTNKNPNNGQDEFEKTQKLVDKENDYLDPEPSSVKNFIQPELADDNYDDDNIERITLEEVRTQLPFLKGASEEIIREFYELLNDSDMPSERRRQELIHLLAVSYLDAEQLGIFNAWSTTRRKKIIAREQQLRNLSFRARDTLKQLALMDEPSQQAAIKKLPPYIRRELRNHVRKRLAQKRKL